MSSHRWYEWDPTKWCILFWSWLGLAWDLQRTDGNEVLQGQVQVLEAEAQQRRDAARWPTPEAELPRITEAEFKHLAEKTRGTRIIMRLRQWEQQWRRQRRQEQRRRSCSRAPARAQPSGSAIRALPLLIPVSLGH